MEIIDFIKLGFNKNEAVVYMSLIKFRKASAGQLIKDTKFHKNIVYDNLEKLIDKGLVNFIIEEGKKIFILALSKAISEYFNEQEKMILGKKELANKIEKEIMISTKETIEKQEATIYRGIRSVKSFYINETLNGNEYFVFGAPKESVEIMGKDFWDIYNNKRTKKRIKAYMIFNPSLKDYGKKLINKYTKIKYFDKNFEPNTETHIQQNMVAIIVWLKEPFIFKIISKTLSESYKKHFDIMWKLAKK